MAKGFGITAKKTKAKKPPVKRVWDTTKLKEAVVPYHRHLISAAIVEDDNAVAKEIHRAVLKWSELTGQEHPGKVYLETIPTGDVTTDENGELALQVRVYIVVETVPEISAR